jgi:uncharacterized cupredoxin-like copper-binding protein
MTRLGRGVGTRRSRNRTNEWGVVATSPLGPGSTKRSSPTLQGGGSGQITVDLQQGTYQLSCSIDGHKDLGMDLTIRVS